mgnify:CR=1 FL=1
MTDYFVHPSSIIDEPCTIGAGTKIWHFCHLQPGCKLGSGCSLGQNVNIAGEVVIGNNVNKLMPEPYHSEHNTYVRNYLTTGHAKIIGIGREVEGRRKDGTTFSVEVRASTINYHNEPHHLVILRDVTERKRTEEELRTSGEKFSKMFRLSPEMASLTRISDGDSARSLATKVAIDEGPTSSAGFGDLSPCSAAKPNTCLTMSRTCTAVAGAPRACACRHALKDSIVTDRNLIPRQARADLEQSQVQLKQMQTCSHMDTVHTAHSQFHSATTGMHETGSM